MSRSRGKVQTVDRADSLRRLRDAREFHDAGVSIQTTAPKASMSLFVQAGIAASDALCGLVLGEYWRGDAHLGALKLLAEAGNNNSPLTTSLRILLGFKDGVQYSAQSFNTPEVLRAERASSTLLQAAERAAAK